MNKRGLSLMSLLDPRLRGNIEHLPFFVVQPLNRVT